MSLLTQNVWSLAPPILPGNACFPEVSHTDWAKNLKKFKQNSAQRQQISDFSHRVIGFFCYEAAPRKLEKVISKINETSQTRKDKQKPSSFHYVPVRNGFHCLGAKIKDIIQSVLAVIATLHFYHGLWIFQLQQFFSGPPWSICYIFVLVHFLSLSMNLIITT